MHAMQAFYSLRPVHRSVDSIQCTEQEKSVAADCNNCPRGNGMECNCTRGTVARCCVCVV